MGRESKDLENSMKIEKLACIMGIWEEQNMLPLALESTKDVVHKYYILHKSGRDKTKEVLDMCIKKWDLNVEYINSEMRLREGRMELIKKAEADGYEWFLIQDGDEVFYTTGERALKNFAVILEDSNIQGIYSPMVYLKHDLIHHKEPFKKGYGKDKILIVPHPTILKKGRIKWCPETGDVPISSGHIISLYSPIKFDCNVKTPLRRLLRTHLYAWEKVSDSYKTTTIEDFAMEKRKCKTIEELEQKAIEYITKDIKSCKVYDENKYYLYPEVIKKYLNKNHIYGYEGELL